MKIVVLDGYTENPGDLSWDEMKKYGELTVYDRTPAEDAGLRYAAAVVVEREVVEIVVLGVLLDRDRDAFAGVIDRIVGQVPEDRVQQRVVSFDRRSAADAVDDLHAVSVQRIFMVGDHLFDDLFQVDRFALEQVGRLFDLGD